MTLRQVVLGSPDRTAAVAFFTELLAGTVDGDDASGTTLVWPGGGRVRIEDAPRAGVLRLDATGARPRTVTRRRRPGRRRLITSRGRVHPTISSTASRTARSASDSGAFLSVAKPSWRGGRSAIANVRSPSSTGGTAVSGNTAMPAPAATRSAMSRMPSTSTGTSSCTPRRAAAASISARSGFTPGGSTRR